MGDSDLERLRRDTNQRTSMAKTLVGWRDWSRVLRTWAGRFQRGRVQEIIRSVEAPPGDEATVAELAGHVVPGNACCRNETWLVRVLSASCVTEKGKEMNDISF